MKTHRRDVLQEIAKIELRLAILKAMVEGTHADPRPETIAVVKGIRRLLKVITS